MKTMITAGCLLTALLACSCRAPELKTKPTNSVVVERKVIRIKTDDRMINLSATWAQDYMSTHPGVIISLDGNGPGTVGLNALKNNHYDMVASSRSLRTTNSPPR